jgi:sortase A
MHLPRLISWIMFGSAFSLFLYVGSNVAYTQGNQQVLTQKWDSSHPSLNSARSEDAPVVYFQRPRLAYEQSLAKIVVPSIDWNGIILEGADNHILSGGPGHIMGTAYPGEPDNVVISNHNSYSLSWGNLKAGQDINLATDYGTFTYRVAGFKIVGADDKKVTASTGHPSLTFITCDPLWAGALATQRYVVLADMVQ